MIISKIILEDCLYYHLHAEQTITSTFADGTSLGVQEKEVTLKTIENVIDDYKVENKRPQFLVLNFDRIVSVQNNLSKKILELLKLNPKLVLINVKSDIIKNLGIDIFNNQHNITDSKGNYLVFYASKSLRKKIETSTENIFKAHFIALLEKKYIDPLEDEYRYHTSSSVYLSKWINIKRFISKDREFFLFGIYQLALKTHQKWFKDVSFLENEKKPVLVCQNLNSSFITSILSTLLRTDIVILDQIGPINKMYSTLDNKIENDREYIVVSDLVCLGTEIKIAKSLIEFLGGKYLGNISMVRIQTINPNYRSFADTECVFVVDKETNKKIGYKITTELD